MPGCTCTCAVLFLWQLLTLIGSSHELLSETRLIEMINLAILLTIGPKHS